MHAPWYGGGMHFMRVMIPLSLLLLTLGGIAFLSFGSGVHRIAIRSGGGIDFNLESQYWSARIRAAGAQQAYAEMATSVARLSLKSQHFEAHAFGEALFETKSNLSNSVCDLRFGQGCFHQYFGDYVHEYGLTDGLKTFSQSCAAIEKISDRRTCEHGIGHGLLGYTGYSEDGLGEALAICKEKVHSSNYTLGCAGGVFMEYDLRTLLLGDAEQNPRRKLTETTRYTPCLGLSAHESAACMFWQPEWWFLELRASESPADAISDMGSYCGALGSQQARQSCYRGLGYSLPLYSRDARTVEAWCASVSQLAADRLACWSYARPQVEGINTEEEAGLLCASLAVREQSTCVRGSDTSAELDTDIDPLK